MSADEPSQGGWSEPDGACPAVESEGSAPADVNATAGFNLPNSKTIRYQLGAFVGRGGMGEVHTARDLRLARDVALKASLLDRPAPAALVREAQITARLDHPGVVAVHDVGTLPDGRAFYTMRLVRGRSLGQALAEGMAADVAARQTLIRHVLAACEAVGYAHAVGLVHRDLKPANVLIGPHGETQVADWGLAAPTPTEAARWADLPSLRAAAGGTRGYVSPEQARGDPPDPRHDVWSLGALLAAAMPMAFRDAPLHAIMARAQAEDLAERYPHAADLAADLARWFEGRRVEALRYGPLDWARWAWRAWRVQISVAGLSLALVALAVGLGWRHTTEARDRALAAERAGAQTLRMLQRAEAVRAALSGHRAQALALADTVLAAGPDPVAAGVKAAFLRQPGAVRSPEVPVLAGEAPQCRWAALAGQNVLCGQTDEVIWIEGGAVRWRAPGYTAGGVVRAEAGFAQVWDDRHETRLLNLKTGALALAQIDPDGDWLPHEHPRRPSGTQGLLDPQTLPPSGCAQRLRVVAVAADGQVAALCEDGRLHLARPGDPAARSVSTPLNGEHVAASLAWLPDGRLVAGSLRGRLVRLAADGGVERTLNTTLGSIARLRVSSDGAWVAAAGAGPGVGLWHMATASLAEVVGGDLGRPLDFGFSGGRLVLVGLARTEFVLPNARPRAVQASAGLAAGALRAEGDSALLAAGDGTVLHVNLKTGAVADLHLGEGVVKAVGDGPWGPWASGMFSPNLLKLSMDADGLSPAEPLAQGRRLRQGLHLSDGSLVGIDVHAGLFRWTAPTEPPARLSTETYAALAPDAAGWLSLDRAGAVLRWRIGQPPESLWTVTGGRALAAAGGWVAVAGRDGIQVWPLHMRHDATAGAPLPEPGATALSLAISPDGTRLAVGDLLGGVYVLGLPGGARLFDLPGHTERVVGLHFLPEGDLLSVSWDGSARLWATGSD